jgi:hypothetical protein
MIFLISISLNDEVAAQKWLDEIELQPRIRAEEKEQLVGFFEKAFGRKPD